MMNKKRVFSPNNNVKIKDYENIGITNEKLSLLKNKAIADNTPLPISEVFIKK